MKRTLHRCLDGGHLVIVHQPNLLSGGELWACQIEPVVLDGDRLRRRTYGDDDQRLNFNHALPMDQLEQVEIEYNAEVYP